MAGMEPLEALRCSVGPVLRSSNLARAEPYAPPKYERWGDMLSMAVSGVGKALLTNALLMLLLGLRLLSQLRWREADASALGVVHASAFTRLLYLLGFLRCAAQLLRGLGRATSEDYLRWHRIYRGGGAGSDDRARLLAVSDYEPRPIAYTCAALPADQQRTFLPAARPELPPGWQGAALRVPGVSNQVARTVSTPARALVSPSLGCALTRCCAGGRWGVG